MIVAHPAIRNRGTTVGSIAHADPAGEMPTVLVLTGGVVEAVGAGGRREIDVVFDLRQGRLVVLLHRLGGRIEVFFGAVHGREGKASAAVRPAGRATALPMTLSLNAADIRSIYY